MNENTEENRLFIEGILDMAKRTKKGADLMTRSVLTPAVRAIDVEELTKTLTEIGRPWCEMELKRGQRMLTLRIESHPIENK